MAGTPTANYQFPTYATTDVPDLTGAYNQAVNAIDAKIKEVADTIPSDVDVPDANSTTKGIAKLYDSATVGAGAQDDGGITPKAVDDKISGSLTGYAPKFTVNAPITYSANVVGVTTAQPDPEGNRSQPGVTVVTGKQQDIADATVFGATTVPNVKAVKDYVDAKVPTEQQAYTGTAPIVVNNEDRTISVSVAKSITLVDGEYSTEGAADGVVTPMSSNAAMKYFVSGTLPSYGGGPLVVTAAGIREWVLTRTPDATTSVKGLVQLTNTFSAADSSHAATPTCVNSALATVTRDWETLNTAATTPLTTEMLANLYVTPSGMVVYKAPTE